MLVCKSLYHDNESTKLNRWNYSAIRPIQSFHARMLLAEHAVFFYINILFLMTYSKFTNLFVWIAQLDLINGILDNADLQPIATDRICNDDDDDDADDHLLASALDQYEEEMDDQLLASIVDEYEKQHRQLHEELSTSNAQRSQSGSGGKEYEKCSVCRGMPSTSSAVCTCGTRQQWLQRSCTNCKRSYQSDGSSHICSTCLRRPYCKTCKRHMDAILFDSNDSKGRCFACVHKANQLTTRSTRDETLTEVEITTNADNDTSFENLFRRISNEVNDIVEQYRSKHG
jgi:hypothetical protein